MTWTPPPLPALPPTSHEPPGLSPERTDCLCLHAESALYRASHEYYVATALCMIWCLLCVPLGYVSLGVLFEGSLADDYPDTYTIAYAVFGAVTVTLATGLLCGLVRARRVRADLMARIAGGADCVRCTTGDAGSWVGRWEAMKWPR